jgi:hypothetical protein
LLVFALLCESREVVEMPGCIIGKQRKNTVPIMKTWRKGERGKE